MSAEDQQKDISDKLGAILISQAKTESFISTIEGRGCAFGHEEREVIKQSILDKETIAHKSIRVAKEAVDEKIDSQSKWLKGLAAISFLFGVAVAWLKLK